MEKSRIRAWLDKVIPVFRLYLIRTVETFAASVVPSAVSVFIIFLAPNERSWMVLSIFSFVLTAAANWYFWLDFVVMRGSVKEFYLVNGTAQALYIGASIGGYYFLGYLVYSMAFAGLRSLEEFGMSTFESVITINAVYVVLMIVCERWARRHTEKIREILKKNNSADKVEMEDKSKELVPTLQNKKVKMLSVEEMAVQVQKDEQERIDAAREAAESEPEQLWNDNISKGHGEEIQRVDYSAAGSDIDEHDHVTANENEAYGADSLWNKEIYNGKEPITDYGDENDAPIRTDDTEDEPLWDKSFYESRGKAAELDELYAEEEATPAPEEIGYDADSLWNSDFYRGTDKSDIPEKVLDLSDEPEKPDEPEDGDERLWGDIYRGADETPVVETDEEEASINPNEDYGADSLWSSDMHMGKQ